MASPVAPAMLCRVRNTLQGDSLVLSDCIYLLNCLVSPPVYGRKFLPLFGSLVYALGTKSVLTELLDQGVSQTSTLPFDDQSVKSHPKRRGRQ